MFTPESSGEAQYLGPDATSDGRFIDLGELGRGSTSSVRRVYDRALDRVVALKTLRDRSPEAAERLIREGRIAGKLNHPHIIPIHELAQDPRLGPYLVLRLVDGTPLDRCVSPNTALLPKRLQVLLTAVLKIASAVGHAHKNFILHRDLKPENILLDRHGHAYLTDWGLAQNLDQPIEETAGILGTPSYLAPELARGEFRQVGPATDIFGLGALLYFVLSGRPPYRGENFWAALAQAGQGKITPLPATSPPILADLTYQSLAFKPSDRPASAAHFAQTLSAGIALLACQN